LRIFDSVALQRCLKTQFAFLYTHWMRCHFKADNTEVYVSFDNLTKK